MSRHQVITGVLPETRSDLRTPCFSRFLISICHGRSHSPEPTVVAALGSHARGCERIDPFHFHDRPALSVAFSIHHP